MFLNILHIIYFVRECLVLSLFLNQFDYYVDNRTDYVHNEVACDYNAGLTGALAAFITFS